MKSRAAVLSTLFISTLACGASLGDESTLSASDPLYAQVRAKCGSEALILRVEDLESDEALCCVTYLGFVPSLHCMTQNGAVVVNPNDAVEIKSASKRVVKGESL